MTTKKPLATTIKRGEHVNVMRTAILRQASPSVRLEYQTILADVLIFADLETRSPWKLVGIPRGDADEFFRDGRLTHLCEVAGFNERAVRRFVADVRRCAEPVKAEAA